ncbi:MAG: helix-turn-helix domain-containing protein, partial [Bacteroidales bacterium]
EKIDALCKEKGISVYQLCKEAGIPVTSGYRILRQKTIGGDKLRRISAVLGVTTDDLLTDNGDPQSVNTYLAGVFNHTTVNSNYHSNDDAEELKNKVIELECIIDRLTNENAALIDKVSNKEEVIKAKDQLINLLMSKKDE